MMLIKTPMTKWFKERDISASILNAITIFPRELGDKEEGEKLSPILLAKDSISLSQWTKVDKLPISMTSKISCS